MSKLGIISGRRFARWFSVMSKMTEISVVETVQEMRRLRREALMDGKTVAFVPTMGALHDGHLDLMKLAANNADVVVTSIFVNPAQFAPHEDLALYPRTLESDMQLMASKTPCKILFLPSVSTLYPSGITLDVDKQRGVFVEVKGMSHQMEGATRPHFFRGMTTVVCKLLNIVQPDTVVFGQKDAQQCCVIRALLRDLHMPTEMIVAPTRREDDGLAMSSRNRYLTADQRSIAPLMYQGLLRAQNAFNNQNERHRNVLIKLVTDYILQGKEAVQLEYVSLVNVNDLTEVQDLIGEQGALLSAAMRVGSTRLIDNVLLNCAL